MNLIPQLKRSREKYVNNSQDHGQVEEFSLSEQFHLEEDKKSRNEFEDMTHLEQITE